MIQLSKSGNTVTFTFDENSGYLQNGTIDVPVNSLSLILDESDMATFRKSASNDIFVSALVGDFGMSKSELEAWYKANMVGSTGGGGGGVTPEEVQTMIDVSLVPYSTTSEVDSMIDSSISGKADADDVYTIEEVDDAISAATDDMATETWVGAQGYITGVDLSNYATLDNVAEAVSGKADIGDIPDVSNYFDGAEYDSGTTRINFYHGNTVKASIDASQFVIDGMIDDVRIETISGVTYLVIDFNTASGKEDIQIPLTDIFDPSNYYNKTEIDNIVSGLNESIDTKLDASAYTPTDLSEYWTSAQTTSAIDAATSGKADTTAVTEAISAATDDMATKTWVGEQGYLTEHQSLSAYSTTEEVNSAITEATSGKVDTSTYNTYTANTATEISNKLAVSDFNSYSGAVDTSINSKASESDLSALTDVVSAHTANTDIHVTTAQTAAWNAKSDFSGSYNDLTDKPTIPTVPTSNTAFTNDAGYITSGDAQTQIDEAVSGKVDTSTFETYSGSVETALSGKQNTLSAGTNITISGNVISATGGGGGTVDPSLDSGSTNPVANSAITSALTADEYNAYECEIVRNGNSWGVAYYDNIRYTYDATDSYGTDVYFRFTNGIIPSSQDFRQEIWRASLDENAIWNGGDIITAVTFIKSDVSSALTATFTGSHIVFKSNDIFSSKGLYSLSIYYGYGEPSDYDAENWEGFNNSVDNEDIFIDEYNTAHTIPSESIKSRVDRLFDMIDSVKDYKAEIKDIYFTDGKAIGNMISWNPVTQKHCSSQSHKLFNYNPKDFSSNENGFSFTKSILDSNVLPYIATAEVIDDLNDGTQYNVSDFGGGNCALLIETDSTYQNQWGDFSLQMQADSINFGEMRFMWQDGRLEVNIMADVIGGEWINYREEFKNVTLGDKLTVDLRYALPGITNLTLTVQNWDIPSFIKKINIYSNVINAVVTFDEWQNNINKTLEELDDKEEAITKALYELKGRIETLENNNN